MILEKIKPYKKAIFLPGLILIAIAITWMFLSDSPLGWYEKIFSVGSSVCHQIPSHSFTSGGIQFPVCARCAGLYLGSFIGLVYALLSGKKKGIPKTGYLIVLGVLFLLWSGDGINSFVSDFLNRPFLYRTSNLTRLITGYGMGLVMSTALGTLFNITVWDSGENSALLECFDQILEYAVLCLASSLLLFANHAVLLQTAGYIVIITVISIISILYTVFWIIAFKKENQFTHWKNLGVFLLAGYATAIGQVSLFVALRNRIL